MRAQDVKAEWVWAFEDAHFPKNATAQEKLRWQLSAVIPLIQKEEREACAAMIDVEIASLTKYRDVFERMGNDEAVRSRQIDIENLARLVVAIRARGEP